ncbi:MAG: hypothetical protein K2X08_03980 [Chlamydiales bacterium]|nr:hypothetical protein [Chlamydiales bacterium]MBY0529888.1 hypothetical protein [Rhabdochlamydiaceae bacterium]
MTNQRHPDSDDQEDMKISCEISSHPKTYEVDEISEKEISEAVETILSGSIEQIHPTFYKNIDPAKEFGVSRFVADRVYHLPKLLENITLSFIQNNTYLIHAESKDPNGNSIRLEHRFKATSAEEAEKLYENINSQLTGVQLKIWLACWKLGDELRRYTYTCQLVDLMKITYSERSGYFSVSEKTEFYEHLKSLEQTKFVFTKPKYGSNKQTKSTSKKKDHYVSFEIPLLQIVSRIDNEEGKAKYPQQITVSIMNLFPHPGKMAFVGAPFKRKTLELHADDTQLATWIQTRKAQRPDEKFITIERGYLIQLASLQRSDAANKTSANQKLLRKLQRIAAKGIIVKAPEKITKEVQLHVR